MLIKKNSEHKRILPFLKTSFYQMILIPFALVNHDQEREYKRGHGRSLI